VIEFAASHLIAIVTVLIALVVGLWVFVFPKRREKVGHPDFTIRLKESGTDPLTFWRNEIRSMAEEYGSPVKAANHLKRSMGALDTMSDDELESRQKYWRELSRWYGRVRVEYHKLDPKHRWHPNAWSQLFNVIGETHLLVKIAWDQRSKNRA